LEITGLGAQMAIAVRGKNFVFAVQCGRRPVEVQQMQSWCEQRTEAADAVRTADTIFLSAPSLQ